MLFEYDETQPPIDVKHYNDKSKNNNIIKDSYRGRKRNRIVKIYFTGQGGTDNRWASGKKIYEQMLLVRLVLKQDIHF